MIKNLREQEEIILYGYVLEVAETEKVEVAEFLKEEFEMESREYPHVPSDFDSEAAVWGASVVYIAAQLILYRKNSEGELANLIPVFLKDLTPSRILSADLCLRFLPDMIRQLQLIDSEDGLVPLLEELLIKWHYSGINYPLAVDKLDFSSATSDKCIVQLYANRILEYKRIPLAQDPAWKGSILAQLGMYRKEYWNELNATSAYE